MTDFEIEEMPSQVRFPQMTGQAISDFLGFSPQWLAKLEKMGFVQRLPNRLFDGGAVCLGYLRFLGSNDRRSAKTEQGRQLEAAQVEKLKIANRKALDCLVDVETIDTTFADIFMLVRTEMATVPAGISDLAMRAELEKRFDGAFSRCQARFDKHRRELLSGQVDLDGVNEEGEP